MHRLSFKRHTMATAIALLGWGSLIWDTRPEFDQHHQEWQADGPVLPLEFARISKTRSGALTLVVEPTCGAPCKVAYARSKRSDPRDAICDLRSREGTTYENIGFYFADGTAQKSRDKTILSVVSTWAKAKSLDAVVWTDLTSNFKSKVEKDFSVTSAVAYLASLEPAGKAAAAEYVWRAPELVVTPLRSALQSQPWFQDLR